MSKAGLSITRDLLPFQRDGRDAALAAFARGDRGYIIGDEMGLGKTPQGLAVAHSLAARRKDARILIICPANLVPKWRAEIDLWLPRARKYSITVASYNEISKAEGLRFVTRENYLLAIFDEVHYLKDFDALRTRGALGAPGDSHKTVALSARYLLGLSGTWPPNRVGELYPWLLRTSHPITHGLTYEQFLTRYAARTWKAPAAAGGLSHKGVKNAEGLRAALSQNFIYRKIDDVAPQLPPGTLIDVPIEVSAEVYETEKKLLVELMQAAGHSVADVEFAIKKPDFLDLLLKTVPSFDRLVEFRQRQGLLKVKPVFDYLKNSVLPELEKFILFTYHKSVAAAYKDLLDKERPGDVYLITGDSDVTQRFDDLAKIDALPRAILVCTIDAVKEGFNLTGFSRSFFAETDWRVYAIEQAQGRTRRLTSTAPAFWTHFVFSKGVERMIYKRLKEKRADLKAIRGK